ncbi:IucA/IucC family protein [Cupriavidus pinatubonensis]|uniref:IucA/IucC family protein n=1 Tax=Cupriavidus pinatubonensis TaxID=248026 RepID=UPI00112B1EE4|nr:IucA/IucC family protein [Cupriavidus pinatubonensis]TPQ27781.1 IucA/IucC family siderophore biosynthesis protein [Cupriavidus pinatubonensis]
MLNLQSASRTTTATDDPAANGEADTAFSRRNALRRLVRCLFAEGILDKTRLVLAPHGRQAWFPLWKQQAIVYFDDLEAAPADTFVNHGSITLLRADGMHLPLDTHEALIDALRDSFDFAPRDVGVDGLKADMLNSVRNDANVRMHRQGWATALRSDMAEAGVVRLTDYLRRHVSTRDAAMLLDQWGALEGHPYYPTWKAKPGLRDDEVLALSPECQARVNVRIGALRADMAYVERMPHVQDAHAWFATQFPSLWQAWKTGLNARGLCESDWLPMPIHSWHLNAHVRSAYANEIADGILIVDGPDLPTLPTMSFRTVLPATPQTAPFIKLPVALWMTSEQRSLQAKSIHMGPRISALIEHILKTEDGFGRTLEIFPEEIAWHYRNALTKDDAPGKHLSVVFRASVPALDRDDGCLPVTVAALFTERPDGGGPLFTELVEAGAGDVTAQDAAQRWFRQYARTVTRPVIAIYLLYGIALEAHQQNTQVLFDNNGQAQRLLVRDFGDGRTYAPLLAARGLTLRPYAWPGILPTVFDGDIEPVRTFVIDACFVSHLHEIALGLFHTYGFSTARLWEILREEAIAAFDAVQARVDPAFWAEERRIFLEDPWSTRSLLRMHLLKYSDYRLQHGLTNPLRQGKEA